MDLECWKIECWKVENTEMFDEIESQRCFNYILTLKSGIELLKGRIKMLISWIYML